MKKPSINEWATDCNNLGILARRVCYANAQLPEEDEQEARQALDAAAHAFVGKYAVPLDYAIDLAHTIADSVDLGLSY